MHIKKSEQFTCYYLILDPDPHLQPSIKEQNL
jgi:hypothetical protein